MNIVKKHKLPELNEILEELPLSPKGEKIKEEADKIINNIILGKDNRLLLIIGPCSADREETVMEYIIKLSNLASKVKEKIFIVPRIYTNKPRTTGEGYKGMLHQPDPNKNPNMYEGLKAIRRLHIKTLTDAGLSSSDEMLYPDNYLFLQDLLSYVAVGARSVENQYHRLVASGLNIPVGMKNPTSGDLNVMMNSINAAQNNHTFVFAGWEVESKGNPLSHAVLRGFTDKTGKSIPNYHYEDLMLLSELYSKSKLKNPAVIIDTNHSNSNKQWNEQPRIAKEVIHSMKHSTDIKKLVKGLMIESYLKDGCQKPGGNEIGMSITDPCLGWEKTEKLVLELANIL